MSKKMSRTLKKHFLNTFCHPKWGGGLAVAGGSGGPPIFDPKIIQFFFFLIFEKKLINFHKTCKQKCQNKSPGNLKYIFKIFFEHFLSSKMGRGGLRLRAARAGHPFLIPKLFKKCFFNVRDIFLTFLLTFL